MDITTINVDKIKPNNWNPNVIPAEVLSKLRTEIERKGMCEPIHVREVGIEGAGEYEIIDGFHRWSIAKEVGITDIPTIVQPYDEQEAKIKTIQLNYMRGTAIPIRMANLIHELSKEMTIEELASRLPYEEVELMDNLELLKLPEDFGGELETKAMEEEEEMPVIFTFVMRPSQAGALEEAIEKAKSTVPEGEKNIRSTALAVVCSQYVGAERVMEEQPPEEEKEPAPQSSHNEVS